MPPSPTPAVTPFDPAAPPQPALAAARVHPDFLVPPSAPYVKYTMDDLLAQPGEKV